MPRSVSCCRWRLRARASVDYFSDIVTNQTFNTDINDSSNNQRSFGGNVVGAWGTYSLSGTLLRSEYFSSQSISNVSGIWPRVTVNRNERPVGDTPVYVSASGEYANILSVGRQRGRRARQRPDAAGLLAAAPLSVQEVAVVHGEFVRELAGDVLLTQPGSGDDGPCRPANGQSSKTT